MTANLKQQGLEAEQREDYDTARDCYTTLLHQLSEADACDAEVAYRIAQCWLKGSGRYPEIARDYLVMAWLEGYASAARELGVLLGCRDLIEFAAESGDAEAVELIIKMCQATGSVDTLTHALHWCQVAAKNGKVGAKQRAEQIAAQLSERKRVDAVSARKPKPKKKIVLPKTKANAPRPRKLILKMKKSRALLVKKLPKKWLPSRVLLHAPRLA